MAHPKVLTWYGQRSGMTEDIDEDDFATSHDDSY